MLLHRILLFLVLLTLCAAVPAAAVVLPNPGIALYRDPAPPDAVLNDGSDTITFTWTIDYDTTCSTPYTFEILNSAMTPIVTQNFSCAASPINNSFIWNPEGQDCGCYYGRVTFYSNWCNGSARTVEDQALVAFIVAPASRFRICKFWDLNGNGVEDPGEPRLTDWMFTVRDAGGQVVAVVTTFGLDGCTDYISVPVECDGTTPFTITETVKDGWTKTAPNGSTNPITVNLTPGTNPDVVFGDWQQVRISGFKFLDQAPWPWTDPSYLGPQGQHNPAAFEPEPICPQPVPPAACISPTQPGQEGIAGVTVTLYKADGVTLVTSAAPGFVNPTVTGAGGAFSFGPFQWEQDLVIKMSTPAPSPPACDTLPAEGGLTPWPGDYFHVVASSVWPTCFTNFTTPDELDISIPVPVVGNQEYGCNYFFNRQPSRLWGLVCQDTLNMQASGSPPLPNLTITVDKIVEAVANPWPSGNPSANPVTGLFVVPEIPAEAVPANNIRQGIYRLTPPVPSDPTTFSWQVTTFCDGGSGVNTFPLPAVGYVDVDVPHSTDVRVDFCLVTQPSERRCFLPVTLTQTGWHNFCDPDNPIIPDGLVFNKFHIAFANFSYFGTVFKNKMIVGQTKTITFNGTTGGLKRLCAFLPQIGPCGKLDQSYVDPWAPTPAGELAGETVALMMNIAYNDMRIMPRTPGYDLEKFVLATGLYKGRKVGDVLNIANSVLGGTSPKQFGLANCGELVDILKAINANYEFIDFNTFIDNGFLIPNRAFGQPDPAHNPVVPFVN